MEEYTYKFNNKKHHARFIKTFEQSAHIFNDYNSIVIMDDFTVKVKSKILFRIIFFSKGLFIFLFFRIFVFLYTVGI